MKPISGFSWNSKLLIGLSLIVALFATVVVGAYSGLIEIRRLRAALYDENFRNMTSLLTVRSNLNAERLDISVMIEIPPSDWTTWRNDLGARSGSDSLLLAGLRSRFRNDSAQSARLDSLIAVHSQFIALRSAEVLPSLVRGDIKKAKRLFNGIQLQRHARMRAILDRMEEGETREGALRMAEAEARTREVLELFVVLGAVFGATAFFLIAVTYRTVSGHLAERRIAEERLVAKNRALKLLSSCNGIAIHAADEEELLNKICRNIVEAGGYKLAWVGYAVNDEGKSVKPVAFAGTDGDYVRHADISWGDNERGRGPTGACIRTGEPVVNRDTVTQPDYGPWRDAALEKGYNSSATFPLRDSSGTYGALMIYSEKTDAFQEDELVLLRELADDLAYATHGLRTRAALTEAEARWKAGSLYTRSLIEASLDPLVTIDSEGRITDVNEATEVVTGASREELIGTDFSEYFTEPDKARAGYKRVLKDGSVRNFELELRHRDGHVTPVSYNAAVYRDPDGKVAGAFAAARDITVQRRAADELRASESRLRAASVYARSLLEASLDPLVTISADGKITDVNTATEKITGRARGELLGTDFSDYFTEPEKARTGYRRVFSEGVVRDYELELRGKNGDVVPVTYNASLYVDESGKAAGVFAAARDVTERKNAEAAVEAQRRRLEDILERLPAYVVLLTPDYHAGFANKIFRDRYGESHGRRCYEFLFERNEPCENCETYKVLQTGTSHEWEWVAPDKRRYHVFDYPFEESNGSKMILEMGIDITEAKLAQEQLRESEQKLRLLTDNIGEVFWMSTPNVGKMVYVSSAFERIWGMSVEELYKSPRVFTGIIHKDDLPVYLRTIEENHARGREYETEYRILPKGKQPIWIREHGYPISDESGAARYMVGSCTDVTEAKLAEEALSRSEAELKEAQRLAQMGNWWMDYASGEVGWSGELYRIFDYDTSLPPPAYPEQERLFTPESWKVLSAALEDTRNTGVPYEVELEIAGGNGHHRWILSRGEPVRDREGGIVGLRGAALDITDRKRAEEEIRELNSGLEERIEARTAELQTANKELESFSYSVSHDLRAPLRSIDGFSLALLEDYSSVLDKKGQDYLKRLRGASQTMAALIDDLLELSRVTRREIKSERIDMTRLAYEIVADLTKSEGSNRVVEFSARPGMIAYGDSHLIRIALENLIGNAWKFTCRTPRAIIEMGETPGGTGSVYFIKDNGAGFDPKYMDKLFVPFQRLHNPAEFPGTGIGLATVKRIIGRHGGEIRAEGEVGKGATFYFTLGRSEKR